MWLMIDKLWVYVPRYFTPEELFPPTMLGYSTSHLIGLEGDLIWLRYDPRILVTADRLRERYGTVLANTYHYSDLFREKCGTHKYRGFRSRNCKTGSVNSYHKLAQAVDLVFLEFRSYVIREDIKSDPFHDDFKYITGIERGVSWLHVDCRPHDKKEKGLYLFS